MYDEEKKDEHIKLVALHFEKKKRRQNSSSTWQVAFECNFSYTEDALWS